jgi:hypothetical protein
MVRALLEGRKTQTRRIMKPQPEEHMHGVLQRFPNQKGCPYGESGNALLWVRETFTFDVAEMPPIDASGNPMCVEAFVYRATTDIPDEHCTWVPSIFMARRASRLTLQLSEVRVQRWQDIGEDRPCRG